MCACQQKLDTTVLGSVNIRLMECNAFIIDIALVMNGDTVLLKNWMGAMLICKKN